MSSLNRFLLMVISSCAKWRRVRSFRFVYRTLLLAKVSQLCSWFYWGCSFPSSGKKWGCLRWSMSLQRRGAALGIARMFPLLAGRVLRLCWRSVDLEMARESWRVRKALIVSVLTIFAAMIDGRDRYIGIPVSEVRRCQIKLYYSRH